MSREVEASKPFVRSSKPTDCHELSLTMREEDKREIYHWDRLSPLTALFDGFTAGKCWTVEWKGKVVAMFGVAKTKDPNVGQPWMLASDDLKRIRKSFLKECHAYVELMFDGYQVLSNHAWAKNDIHIQWLKWLGFKFFPAKHMGYDRELFYEFYKVNNHV